MDIFSKDKRSKIMSNIKSNNTSPELIIRKLIWNLGYRYRLQYKLLPGKPDLAFISRKKAVFVNGCFWHQHKCLKGRKPLSNESYWHKKLDKNKKRDNQNYYQLKLMSWKYIIIWECQLKNIEKLKNRIIKFLN